MACSAAPGGLLVLAAWVVSEKEVDRVESGYLPADTGPTVRRLQRACFVGLLFVLAAFSVQLLLFMSGFYEGLWEQGLTWLASYVSSA